MTTYPYAEVIEIESAGYYIVADVRVMFDAITRLELRRVRLHPRADEYRLVFPGVHDGGRNHRDSVVLPKSWRLLVQAAILEEAGLRGYLANAA